MSGRRLQTHLHCKTRIITANIWFQHSNLLRSCNLRTENWSKEWCAAKGSTSLTLVVMAPGPTVEVMQFINHVHEGQIPFRSNFLGSTSFLRAKLSSQSLTLERNCITCITDNNIGINIEEKKIIQSHKTTKEYFPLNLFELNSDTYGAQRWSTSPTLKLQNMTSVKH